MKEHPILFSTEMVQAILAGRKTETRRIIKPQPDEDCRPKKVPMYIELEQYWRSWAITKPDGSTILLEKYNINDILWVKETWSPGSIEKGIYSGIRFKANDPSYKVKWKPSLFLAKKDTRIWLQIENVFNQQVQDITIKDALAEGVEAREKYPDEAPGVLYYRDYSVKDRFAFGFGFSAKDSFKSLWEKINGVKNWKENPWVWVIKFKVLSTTGRPKNI